MPRPGFRPRRRLTAQLSAFVMSAVFLVAPAGPAAALAPAPEPPTARFEIDFLMDMIDHHAMAVEMAEMCLDKAIHPELEEMCAGIVSSQSQEIAEMSAWLQDWYGVSHEPEMKPGDMREMERLASLSGAAFEIEFMETMIKHHSKAIREAEQCLRQAYHTDLVALCQNIIAAQTAEIALMEEWLCEWYDRCRGSLES